MFHQTTTWWHPDGDVSQGSNGRYCPAPMITTTVVGSFYRSRRVTSWQTLVIVIFLYETNRETKMTIASIHGASDHDLNSFVATTLFMYLIGLYK
jgi:hypothetical protein